MSSVGDWLDITSEISRLVSIAVVNRLVVGINVSRFVTTNVSRFVSTINDSRLVVGTVSRLVVNDNANRLVNTTCRLVIIDVGNTNVSRFAVNTNASRLVGNTNVSRLVALKGEDLAENNCFTL